MLEELNGNILWASVATFHMIPYVKQEHLDGWVQLIEAWDDGQSESPGSDLAMHGQTSEGQTEQRRERGGLQLCYGVGSARKT